MNSNSTIYIKVLLILSITVTATCCQNEKVLQNDNNPQYSFNILDFNIALERYQEYGFSGGVMIEKNDEVIYSKAFGYADYERHIKNNKNTLFDLGSITKHFTAAAILKLESEGKLNLSDSISRYFTNLSVDKRMITIQQLLNHTSGLKKDPSFNKNTFNYLNDISIILERTTLINKPIEKFSYSNFGYCVLGLIIEKVSGKSYQNYIESEFFDKYKMDKTKFYNSDIVDNFSFGYETLDFEKHKVDPYMFTDIPIWQCGASGIVTNFEDMHVWFTNLFNNRVLDEKIYQKMTSPIGAASEIENPYGYGIRVINWNNQMVIFHDGDTSGHQIKFIYFPESGYRFLFYINNRDRWKNKIEKLIFNSLLNKPLEILPSPNNEVELNNLPKTNNFEIKKNDDQYFIVALNQKGVLMLSENDLTIQKANHLDSISVKLAHTIINNDAIGFSKFINSDRENPKERFQKIKNSFAFDYNKATVLGITTWKTKIYQSHVRFNNENNFEVIRFVWHPRKDELILFGSGKNELLSKRLYHIDSSSFITFDPKENKYKSITINENEIIIN